MTTETISVPEVHCGHCVSSIEGALGPLDGISKATVDLESTSVTVEYDPDQIDRQTIVSTIEAQGYAVSA